MFRLIYRLLVFLFAFALLFLVIRLTYLYFDVGKGIISRDKETASVFYGRPVEIRTGDDTSNIRLIERLQRLSYKKVARKPSLPGTFSTGKSSIRIFLRSNGNPTVFAEDGPVVITVDQGKISSITSAGKQVESFYLEPEEIGHIMGPYATPRQVVDLADIPPSLQNAVIAAEDAKFYHHPGIDAPAIGRALLINFKEKQFAQGASTITQQLAKNFFLSPRKTIARKLREAEIAFALELRYSKKKLLEMYLNNIYWGHAGSYGVYGAEEAAAYYFSKHVRDINLEEAALLAGMIHAPNHYSSLNNPDRARARRNFVLARMKKTGHDFGRRI